MNTSPAREDIPKSQTVEDCAGLHLYEIYTYNTCQINDGCYEGAQPGTVDGWDILWVLSTDEKIESFPFFDIVITKNDDSTGRSIGAYIWK